MKRRILWAVIAAVILIIIFSFSDNSGPRLKEPGIFHVTLADPDLYKNGIFSDSFYAKEGMYQFRFIPNGDSPKTLSINLEGKSIYFSEYFELEGTIHQTGVSEYYTWDYNGVKEIHVKEDQEVEIEINPHGNILGPVSVDLVIVE